MIEVNIPISDRMLGIVLMIVAAVLVVVALLIGYAAVERWSGVNATRSALRAQAQGNGSRARSEASRAAALLPDEPAALLPSIDLESPSAAAKLLNLRNRVSDRQRAIVDVALQLNHALTMQPIEDVAGANGQLIASVAASSKGQLASLPVAEHGDAPYRTVLECAYAKLLQVAWSARDAGRVRTAAGALQLLSPKHPQASELMFVITALDPDIGDKELNDSAQPLPPERRAILAKLLAELAPAHAAALADIAMGATPGKADPKAALAATIDRAIKGAPTASALDALCFQALDQDQPELARKVVTKMEGAQRDRALGFINDFPGTLGDAFLAAAGEQALLPRPSRLRAGDGFVAFHLSNEHGLLPKLFPEITLNDQPVGAAQLRHWGSLIVVLTDLPRPYTITVRVNDHVLFSQGIAR